MTTTTNNVASLIAREEAARAEYERTTIGMADDMGTEYTIAELRAAFDKVGLGWDWKRPFTTEVTADESFALHTAIRFFHGARPKLNPGSRNDTIRITSPGYQG